MNHLSALACSVSPRGWFATATAGAAIAVALLLAGLVTLAASERQTARQFVAERLLVMDAAYELRDASQAMQLALDRLALWPADRRFLAAYDSAYERAMTEARRARPHAEDGRAGDVVDEIENALLRFNAAAGEALAAARADRSDLVRAQVAATERSAAELDELTDEFVTVAATAAEEEAGGLAGSGPALLLLGLLPVAALLGLHAGMLAARESGAALRAIALELLALARLIKRRPAPDLPPIAAPTPNMAPLPIAAEVPASAEPPAEFAVVVAPPAGSDEPWHTEPLRVTVPAAGASAIGAEATPPPIEAEAPAESEEPVEPTPIRKPLRAKPKRNPLFAAAGEETEDGADGSAA